MDRRETPFCLVYRSEAITSFKIAVSTCRLQHFNSEINNVERRLYLYMEDDKRWAFEEAHGRMRLATTRYYHRRVLAQQVFVGKWCSLRQNEFAHHDKRNKLSTKWKSPYKVVVKAHPYASVLEDMLGKGQRIHLIRNT